VETIKTDKKKGNSNTKNSGTEYYDKSGKNPINLESLETFQV
jgi:hypothetical protein